MYSVIDLNCVIKYETFDSSDAFFFSVDDWLIYSLHDLDKIKSEKFLLGIVDTVLIPFSLKKLFR